MARNGERWVRYHLVRHTPRKPGKGPLRRFQFLASINIGYVIRHKAVLSSFSGIFEHYTACFLSNTVFTKKYHEREL